MFALLAVAVVSLPTSAVVVAVVGFALMSQVLLLVAAHQPNLPYCCRKVRRSRLRLVLVAH
jgi:hypothetical protein